jgi:cysteine synthase A
MNSREKIRNTGLLKLIGNTPMIKIDCLSRLSGSDIFMKCETFNPGGTVKDRPALSMVMEAILDGSLKPGQTIVEGTAGNTGIGLALVGSALGFPVIVVMPKGQDQAKHKLLKLFNAKCVETDAVPFTDERHFFKVGKKIGTSAPEYWWANQFDNLHNFKSHFETTGPELFMQMKGEIDVFVAAAGTGGTIAGISSYLKQMNPKVKIGLVDPSGSGLCSYVKKGEFISDGAYTMTEGVGITRLVENFKLAKVDEAFTLNDQVVTSLAYFIRQQEGLVMGMSSMLNLAGAFFMALKSPKGSKVATLMCDGGDRATNKMYSEEFLKEKNLSSTILTPDDLITLFQSQPI